MLQLKFCFHPARQMHYKTLSLVLHSKELQKHLSEVLGFSKAVREVEKHHLIFCVEVKVAYIFRCRPDAHASF